MLPSKICFETNEKPFRSRSVSILLTMTKLGIPKELNDRRVGMVPAVATKLLKSGVSISIENNAGVEAGFDDASYPEEVTAESRANILSNSDIIITVHPIPKSEWGSINPKAILISLFQPYADQAISGELKEKGFTAFSLDMIPRTTIAQSMDVLSSMAAIAGYKAVLKAAELLPRYFPMMITAAGSVKPSKVLVLGAGVAGLQAIATAKRLGAMVEAFDVRKAAKEEVQSLGAKFIEIEGAKDDVGAGGYAVAQSEDFIKRQQAEVQSRASKSDVIITTAQVRGRKAPTLLPADTVRKMKPGSVIIDLASSTGGNCELSKDGELVLVNGVQILGNSNLAADMPQDASLLFSNNVNNFVQLMIKEGELNIDFTNEILKSSCITNEAEG